MTDHYCSITLYLALQSSSPSLFFVVYLNLLPPIVQSIRSPSSLGLILAFVGTLLFSFKSIVVKLAYAHGVVGEQLIALRMIISAPIYLLILLWHHHRMPIKSLILKQNLWRLGLAGLSGYYLASLLDLWGLERVTAQLERLLLFTYPGFVMLLSLLFYKKLPSRITMLSLIITYCGVAFVIGVEAQQHKENVLLGAALITLSAILFAGYLVLSKAGIAVLGSQVFTCIAMLVASAAVGVHMVFLSDLAIWGLPLPAYWWAVVMSLVCTVLPSLLIAAAIARLGPQLTSILGGLGPVMTAFLAVVVLGEMFTIYHFIGTALVVFGAWLVVFEVKKTS